MPGIHGTGGGIPSAWVLCAVALVLSGCSDPVAPSATPTVTPTPAQPPATRLQLSGRVTDDSGAPVANATVAVDYSSAGGPSNPPSTCPSFGQFCWLSTRSSDSGHYAVEFEPRPWAGRGLGFVYSFRDGFEVDVQWVPVSQSPAVRDMRLRPTRRIQAGDSKVITVDPGSSLCTDLEDNWALDHRCEIVIVDAGAGTLTVEARAVTGDVAPFMFWYTTGNYAGLITRPRPGSVSIPVRGGEYRIMVGLPEGAPARQFAVTTSLR